MPSHPKISVRHSPRTKVGKTTTKAVPEPKNPKDVKKTLKDLLLQPNLTTTQLKVGVTWFLLWKCPHPPLNFPQLQSKVRATKLDMKPT